MTDRFIGKTAMMEILSLKVCFPNSMPVSRLGGEGMQLFVHVISTNTGIAIRPFNKRCRSCHNRSVHRLSCPSHTLVCDDNSLPVLLFESLVPLVRPIEEVRVLHSSWPILMAQSLNFRVPMTTVDFAPSKSCSCNPRCEVPEIALTQSINCT